MYISVTRKTRELHGKYLRVGVLRPRVGFVLACAVLNALLFTTKPTRTIQSSIKINDAGRVKGGYEIENTTKQE